MARGMTMLCLSVILAGCGRTNESAGTTSTPPVAVVSLGEKESGQTAIVAVGQSAVVTLPTWSCGCSWMLRISPSDVVASVAEPEYVWEQPTLPGSAGVAIFRLKGARAGRATLEFEYRRTSEVGSAPYQTVRYDFLVR
jgi:predicted secreted protein